MASVVYNSFKKDVNGAINWGDNGTTIIKAMLVTDLYVPNIDTDLFASDISNEVAGTNYVAGGSAILTRSVTIDNANDIGIYDGDNVTWGTSTITARGAVIYKDTGVAGTSPLICFVDFLVDKTSDGGDFIIQWHPNGIFSVA